MKTKQINFFLHPEDCLSLQDIMRKEGFRIFSAVSERHFPEEVDSITDGESIKCLVLNDFKNQFVARQIEGKTLFSFRHKDSLHIELWLPKYDGETLKRGRLFFEPNDSYYSLNEPERAVFDAALNRLWSNFKKNYKAGKTQELKKFRLGKVAEICLQKQATIK